MFRKSFRSAARRSQMAALVAAVTVFASAFAGAAQAQTSSQCSMFYSVERGDTLSRIARSFNVSVSNLVTWNNIQNPNRILAGQQLCVGRTVIVDDTSSNRTHVVQRGETLMRIARHYGVSWRVLADVNKLSNPNRIYAGQTLQIPDVTIQAAG